MIENMDLMLGARVAVEMCMKTRPEEEVLVVTDTEELNVGYAFALAARSIGAEAVVITMSPRQMHGNEPPKTVAEAMKAANVVLMPTSKSLSHTTAREEATKKGARIASMPTITPEIIKGPLIADYNKIKEKTLKLSAILTAGSVVKITTPSGTDLELDISGRTGLPDTGIFDKPGDFGNLPAGEAYIAPVEGKGDGVLVIDGAMAGIGILSTPLRLKFENGKIVSIEGQREAKSLQKILESADDNAWKIAELGIGTNDKASLLGNVLVDEKVFGTIHVAVGDNSHFGGKQASSIHLDGIVYKPTLIIDNNVIIKDGKHLV